MGASKGNTDICSFFYFGEEIRIEKCEEIYQILKQEIFSIVLLS
jgi:hypothetical protein